ncbi:MAG: LamG-like jellyroll fold domain-containing protein, partial [Deltaproteobacteria bacterium]
FLDLDQLDLERVFDGSDDRLENTSLDYGLIDEDASIFVALTPTSNRGLIIDQSFGHGGNEYGWNLHRGDDDWATIPQNSIVWNSHNYVGNQNYGMYAYSEENTSPINQKQLISLIKDGNQLAFHVNGYSTEMVDDTIYASNITYNSGYSLNIGRKVFGPDYLGFMPYDGDINEVIIFNRKLTNEEIIEIQSYLKLKWNLESVSDSDGDVFVDTVDPEPTQSSLLAHYKFNGNANDSSGNNLDGVVHNATLTADRFNNSDKAYSFDGSSYIEIPDDPILTNTASLSISAWFKPVSSSNWTVILQKGSHDSDEEYVLAVTDQQVYFDVGASSGPYIQQSAAINAGEWNHVVATHLRTNGTSVLKVFVNGQDIGGSVNGSSLSPGDNNQSLKIGTRTGHGQYFEGQLDDIRIYGSVLSSEEVNLLYRENLTFTADSDGDGVMDADDPYPFRLPHRYWRVRTLEQKNVWNIKELQFYADTNLYDSTQNTIGVPSPTSIHNGANCIRSGQYGSHGCDRAFDNNLDSWWSNWAAGYESQTWIGMDFGSSPQDIMHVRIMAGRPAAGNREALVEWSDDKISWTEWTGNRIWIREKVDRQSADSRTNTWDEGVAQ